MKRFVSNSMWNGIVETLAVALLVAAIGVASPANALTLNVQFRGDGSNLRTTYTALGAAPDKAESTYWNGLDTVSNDSSTFSSLVYSDNSAATGISLQMNDVNCYTAGGAISSLFNGWLNAPGFSSATSRSISIKGLNDSLTYDLYLYSAMPPDWGGSNTNFIVNGASKHLASDNTGTFVPDANYAKFAGVSSTGGQLDIMFGGWTSTTGQFNGLQLVSLPEPGMIKLLSAGLLGLLAYVWRKRK